MNNFAYRTTGFAIKTISNLSKAQIRLHDESRIPPGPNIFVINHFTRLETFLMPYLLFKLTKTPIWSLAAFELFQGSFGRYLETVGAVSTKDPHRDRLVVKSLLTGEASWIIFPEGRMVKNKKIIEKGRFMVSMAGGKHPPHTGAATLAMRTEFYRERFRALSAAGSEEAEHLMERFRIDSLEPVLANETHIVPVNITYYPVRVKENILSSLATRMVEDLPERVVEEIMTEGSMLISGVDIDIRFGHPIRIRESLEDPMIAADIRTSRRFHFDDPIESRTIMRREALELMQRYMRSIYGMTTVNHDHLFASMLRSMPRKKINEQDLRRRVFMVISRIRENKNIYLHKALEENQVHLLTDDRFGKVRDFLTIAEEKGILSRSGDGFLKEAAKFSSPYDFHRARIDNPIDVMANAVEPLTDLQRTIRTLAYMPGFVLRRKAANLLVRQAEREFETDYRSFFIEGESKPKDVGRPVLIRGRSRRMGIVLSHGYMAAPLEVRELAEYLRKLGYWVYLPRLIGHGTSPDDLATRSYRDWVDSIDRGYAIMSCLCRGVIAGGFSTGAGLALDLASRVNSVKAVFAVSAPLRLKDVTSKFAAAVDMWNRFMAMTYRNGPKKEFVENKSENPHINYLRNPISGVVELERLMDDLEPKLAEISVPTLIIQSRGDPVVDPKSSSKIFEQLGTEDKQYILFNFDRHGILRGPGSDRVHRAIGDFVEGVR